MYVRVIASSKSPGISDGLTYATDGALLPGTLVEVPLRSGTMEGMVIEMLPDTKLPFAVKPVTRLIGNAPVLTPALVQTGLWMAKEYMSPLRQVFSVILPATPWKLLSSESKAKNRDTPQHERQTNLNLMQIALTPEQERAKKEIQASPLPSLLMGLPGTGKTEVVRALVADAVQGGKQAIVLVPEILMSEHSIDRFAEVLPRDRIALIHSKITPAKRREYHRKMMAGGIDVVIGSRTALFSPLPQLGLIAIEEEHEWTYKHEQTPRYNTRDVAHVFAGKSSAKLVFSSSTPSLELWNAAQKKELRVVTLVERFGNSAAPVIQVVDLSEGSMRGTYPLSPILLDAISETLARKEQIVLFINRSGDFSGMLCLDCKSRMEGTNEVLCPKCSSTRLLSTGAGTQVVERILRQQFPNVSIVRADQDAKTLDTVRELKKFAGGHGDVLLGTQSVVQGLDFPNVTLSAVVISDMGLSRPDFRAGERVFQHLVQLAGRSGRRKQGSVIFQAFNPRASEIVFAKNADVPGYLASELALRHAAGYPPAVRMARLLFTGPAGEIDSRVAEQDLRSLTLQTGSTAKFARKRRFDGAFQILLRASDIHSVLRELNVRNASIDIDPVDVD